jgi:hypothetical protein
MFNQKIGEGLKVILVERSFHVGLLISEDEGDFYRYPDGFDNFNFQQRSELKQA